MIRLRNNDSTTTDIPKSKTVEMLDATGRLALVVSQHPGGAVHILTPGDPVFNAYCNVNKLQPSKVHVHEPFASKSLT